MKHDLEQPAQTPPALPRKESEGERRVRKNHESDLLDEGLEESFPASDPVSPFFAADRSRHLHPRTP